MQPAREKHGLPSVDPAWLADLSSPRHIGMDPEQAASIANRVAIHLHRGSIEQARKTLEEGWSEFCRETPTGPALLAEPVSTVITDARLVNTLEKNGVETVGDLLRSSPQKIRAIPSIGWRAANKLNTLAAGLRIRAGLAHGDAGP